MQKRPALIQVFWLSLFAVLAPYSSSSASSPYLLQGSPLMEAIYHFDLLKVQQLLAANPDAGQAIVNLPEEDEVESAWSNLTPLAFACALGDVRIVEALLNAHAELHQDYQEAYWTVPPARRFTPLQMAVHFMRKDVIEFLISRMNLADLKIEETSAGERGEIYLRGSLEKLHRIFSELEEHRKLHLNEEHESHMETCNLLSWWESTFPCSICQSGVGTAGENLTDFTTDPSFQNFSQVLRNTTTLPCGHSFCNQCIEQWKSGEQSRVARTAEEIRRMAMRGEYASLQAFSCPECRNPTPHWGFSEGLDWVPSRLEAGPVLISGVPQRFRHQIEPTLMGRVGDGSSLFDNSHELRFGRVDAMELGNYSPLVKSAGVFHLADQYWTGTIEIPLPPTQANPSSEELYQAAERGCSQFASRITANPLRMGVIQKLPTQLDYENFAVAIKTQLSRFFENQEPRPENISNAVEEHFRYALGLSLPQIRTDLAIEPDTYYWVKREAPPAVSIWNRMRGRRPPPRPFLFFNGRTGRIETRGLTDALPRPILVRCVSVSPI